MHVTTDFPFELFTELSINRESGADAIHRESVQSDLAELVEEAFVGGVLADALPADVGELRVAVTPVWDQEPRAQALDVRITERAGEGRSFTRRFESGRWMRRALETTRQFVEDGTLEEGALTYVHLLAEGRDDPPKVSLPLLQAPTITEQSLDEFGVRDLGGGELCPDRPVLVNERMLEEILRHTEEAGTEETGGGTLGKMIRLDQPLPGTSTRIVTVLSASLVDTRHDGTVARITFDPAALQEAAQVAQLRAKGETVLTAFHTHGWGTACGKCNQNTTCTLPSATLVSLDDYQVLECLFPSKATLMPIAGRKLGAPGTRPILEIHAWRGGKMASIPWRTYRD
ncbi:MAG: hypothetical protein V3T24_03095 [Longimicrobiales bacterium]